MKLGTVAHSCDPSIWEIETEGLKFKPSSLRHKDPFKTKQMLKGEVRKKEEITTI